MLAIKEHGNPAYTVKGYLADMSECMSETAYGLEEAIATAQVEWCEGQYSAAIYDAESGVKYVEIDNHGSIYLAGTTWEIEMA